jgi:hypothetical protein
MTILSSGVFNNQLVIQAPEQAAQPKSTVRNLPVTSYQRSRRIFMIYYLSRKG